MVDKPLICRKCGKPYLPGEALYTLHTDVELGICEHWECGDRRSPKELIADLDAKAAEALALIGKLKRRF